MLEELRVRIVVELVCMDCHRHGPKSQVTAQVRHEELVVAKMGVYQIETEEFNLV